MFEPEVKEQLRSAFLQLEHIIELVYEENQNPDQQELIEMLTEVSSTTDKVKVRAFQQNERDHTKKLPSPYFEIFCEKKPTGIAFQGIPGGHEFTSLILSILYSDKKGKQPDSFIIERIKRLKGPIDIKTYISLTCENCPDVVQALNLMASYHDNFKHTMVDGAYVQNEIADLGIQGVPSIFSQSKLIHSGRIQFIDILQKLEETFGSRAEPQTNTLPKNLGQFDVLIIGGGPAACSAAIYSARKGLKTAIVADKIGGQVQETKGIENLISVPYTEGPRLVAQLNQHLAAYPIDIFENRRVKNITLDPIKNIFLDSDETILATSIIIATGAKWRELGIPGEREYIGKGVAFCPHCDGPYYKNKKVAVIGGGNSGVEAALDLAGIVREVILFEFQDQLKADAVLVNKLKSTSNISIKTSAKTLKIIGDDQKVLALEYLDRTNEQIQNVELDGIFVQIGLVPNSQFIKGLIKTTPFGEIIVDEKGRTSAPGIYAAGDVTTAPYKQIIIAMGDGAKTALAAFEDRMIQQH